MAVAGVEAATIKRVFERLGLVGGATATTKTVYSVLRCLNGRKAKLKKVTDEAELRDRNDVQLSICTSRS